MTSFELEVLGRTRVVSIESSGADRYRVVVDGVPRVVQAVRAGDLGLSIIVEAGDGQTDAGQTSAPGSIRDVQVAPGGRGELLVSLSGRTVVVIVNGRRRGRGAADAAGHAAGAQAILAPMPGRVVRLLVANGDVVAARQPVVVVEAMKMENELRAPKAGTVKDLSVTAGLSVEAGKVLMVIE